MHAQCSIDHDEDLPLHGTYCMVHIQSAPPPAIPSAHQCLDVLFPWTAQLLAHHRVVPTVNHSWYMWRSPYMSVSAPVFINTCPLQTKTHNQGLYSHHTMNAKYTRSYSMY